MDIAGKERIVGSVSFESDPGRQCCPNSTPSVLIFLSGKQLNHPVAR